MSMAPIGGLSPWAKRKQSVWRGSISEASGVTPQEPMKVENTYRYEPFYSVILLFLINWINAMT